MQRMSTATFIPVPTSPKYSPSPNETMIFMTENYLWSFLLSLSENTTFRELLLLSPSSPIIRISHTSKTPINYLADKHVGPSSCKTSTLNGLSLLVLKWALLTPSLAKTPRIPSSTTRTPLLSPTLSLLMPSTLPSPHSLPNLPYLTSSFYMFLPDLKRATPSSLAPPSLTGTMTMAICTLKVRCLFPHPPDLHSCMPYTHPPSRAIWASFTPSPSSKGTTSG